MINRRKTAVVLVIGLTALFLCPGYADAANSFEQKPAPPWVHEAFFHLAENGLLKGAELVYSPNKVYSRLDGAILTAAALSNLGNRKDLVTRGIELETLRDVRRLTAEFIEDMAALFREEIQELGERILAVEGRIRELEAFGEGKTDIKVSKAETRPDIVRIEALFREASYQCKQGKLWEAVSSYQKIIAMDPMHVDAYVSLGIVYLYLGEHEKAFYAFRKVIAIDDRHIESILACGDIMLFTESWNEADAYYRRVLDIDPANKEANLNLGAMYTKQGELNKAFMQYTKLLELRPYDQDALLALGLVYQWKRAYDKAEVTFKKVLSIEPKSKKTFLFLGRLYRESDRLRDSELILRQYLRYDSGDTDTLLELAKTLVEAGVPEEAVATYARVLTIHPDSLEVMELLIELHMKRTDLPSVTAVCKRMLEIDENNRFAHLMLSRLERADGELAISAYHCAAVLQLDPHDAEALAAYGSALLEMEDEDEALNRYRESLRYDSGQVEANTGLGIIYLKRDQYEESERYLGRALAKEPDNYAANMTMATLCKELDMLMSAAHYAAVAGQAVPGDPAAEKLIEELDRLDNFLGSFSVYTLDGTGKPEVFITEGGAEAPINDLFRVGMSFGRGELKETGSESLKHNRMRIGMRYRFSMHMVNEAEVITRRYVGAPDSTVYGVKLRYMHEPLEAGVGYREYRLEESIAVVKQDVRMEETSIFLRYQLLPDLRLTLRPSWSKVTPDGNKKREMVGSFDYRLPGPLALNLGYRSNFYSFERESMQGLPLSYFVPNRFMGNTFTVKWKGQVPGNVEAEMGYDWTRYSYRITENNLNANIPAGNYKGVAGKVYLRLDVPIATYSKGSLLLSRTSTDSKAPPVELKAAREMLLSLSLRF